MTCSITNTSSQKSVTALLHKSEKLCYWAEKMKLEEILQVNPQQFSILLFLNRGVALVADGVLLSEKTRTELGHKKRGQHNAILWLCSLIHSPLRTVAIQP